MNIDEMDRDHGHELLRQMVRIRRFEEKCVELYSAARIRGFLHLYIGEEAVAVGVSQVLRPEDAVVSTYREHGHALSRGVPAVSIMAEMFGKMEGCSRGRGGSMHLFDVSRGFYGGNAIVAAGLPVAVGLALADHMQRRPRVTTCFFGEGAVAEGEFHEAMNLASLWKLPVVFCCENNLYAMGTALEASEAETNLAIKASGYEMAAWSVDGMDVVAVESAARRAVESARAGGGPVFLEMRTYRFRAHSMYDPERYRERSEVEIWKQRDPIVTFTGELRDAGLLDQGDVDAMEREIVAELNDAVEGAEKGTDEPVDQLTRFVHSERVHPRVPGADESTSTSGRTITYRDAMREALHEALGRDDRVFLMGEDVGRYGGCFAVSMGLLEAFGPQRVRDTPLSESGFVGAGIGAALGGMRPIVEIMTVNFSLLALDQIMNNAATLQHMSGGQCNVPLVIRMTTGAGRQLGAQHSHSLEGWYAHIPGLKVLTPATVTDARWMLWTALEDPDPVLIFEHGALYNTEGVLPEGIGPVGIDEAAIRRTGSDVSLVTYGGTLAGTLQAAETLASEGIDAEVIDLRTLRPLDTATILASVTRTHRMVVIDEGWRSGSISAEISARVTEQAFYDLAAPVMRVCTAEVPIPYARHMEEAALPQVSDIVAAARTVVETAG